MSEFWHEKHVLVTGGAGMIGSALVKLLYNAGAQVAVIDNFSRGNTRVQGVAYIIADASNPQIYSEVFHRFSPTHIFNLVATVAGVEFNSKNQFKMFSENAQLQLVPLQAAVEYGRARFLQVSSVCVYAPGYNSPARECPIGHVAVQAEPTEANAGYSQSKRIGELAVQIAVRDGLDAIVVRPTNVYGINDHFDERAHVIPSLIDKTMYDEVIHVNSGSGVVREFINSKDVAIGMINAMEFGVNGDTYVLGSTGDSVSMATLAELIRDVCGMQHKQIVYGVTAPGIDDRRFTDCKRTYRKLKWKPTINLRNGLREMVDWYRGKGR
jgi:nucleoside-diphosphate-sugar epimerase